MNKNLENVFYSHICAVAKNHTIGMKGKLPWHIPEDLKFFKRKTQGKALIMGRKTFESLGKPLENRLNVVLSRKLDIKNDKAFLLKKSVSSSSSSFLPSHSLPASTSLVVCSSLKKAMSFCEKAEVLKKYGQEIFIIGGGEIYKQSLKLVKYIYLTRIHKAYPGDAFYPEVLKKDFREIKRQDRKGSPSYSFLTYERKSG